MMTWPADDSAADKAWREWRQEQQAKKKKKATHKPAKKKR